MGAPKADLADILIAVRDRLIAKRVFTPERVTLSLRMMPPTHFMGDNYAVITPIHFMGADGWTVGEGRQAVAWSGAFDIYVRSRLDLDVPYSDFKRLTDKTKGYLRILTSVVNAIHLWLPEDEDGNPLTVEPLRCVMKNEPRAKYDDPSWLDGCVEVNCLYCDDVDADDNPEGLP